MKDPLPRHAKDTAYETLLEGVNRALSTLPPGAGGEDGVAKEQPRWPTVFVVGLPRSGTTLASQVLAASDAFGYCTNFNARFFSNPGLGARLQRLAEPLLERGPISFRSEYGRTTGWYEPHEFGHFWKQFLPLGAHHEPTAEDLARVDTSTWLARLADFERALGKPLLFKNIIIGFVLPFLARHLAQAVFIRVRRSPLLVAQSIHRMRIEHLGSDRAWYSIRPRRGVELESAPAAEQIAFQIASLEASLDRTRVAVGVERWLEVDYRALCEDPRGFVRQCIELAGVELPEPALPCVPGAFDCATQSTSAPEVLEALETALRAHGLVA